jgi:hypothetical protein
MSSASSSCLLLSRLLLQWVPLDVEGRLIRQFSSYCPFAPVVEEYSASCGFSPKFLLFVFAMALAKTLLFTSFFAAAFSSPQGPPGGHHHGGGPVGSPPGSGGGQVSPSYDWIFQNPLPIPPVAVPKYSKEVNGQTIQYYELTLESYDHQVYPNLGAAHLTAYSRQSLSQCLT